MQSQAIARRGWMCRWALGGAAALLIVGMGWLAWTWWRVADDVEVMLVPTVTLPTWAAAPSPTSIHAAVPRAAEDAGATPTAAPPPDRPLNILLLGTDTRPGDAVSRTDALLVAHVDPRAGRVAVLSLPRDLWVAIPGQGQARVNAAYPIGERRLGRGFGPPLAKQTVSDLLGIPIDRFVLIDLAGFKTLVDTLGGITVDVPAALDDPAYPTDDYRTVAVHFDAGPQPMDGARALTYARTRHADNDFGRNQRQQRVLMAIFERIKQQGLLGNLANLDTYTAALRDSLRTDLSREEMLSLAHVGVSLRSEAVERYAIGSKDLVALPAPATFAADPQALRQRVADLLGAEAADEKGALSSAADAVEQR